MASGMGEGGEQVAPLGQAVIGGLIMSTFTSLLVLPHLFMVVRKRATRQGVSLDPDDPQSRYYSAEKNAVEKQLAYGE